MVSALGLGRGFLLGLEEVLRVYGSGGSGHRVWSFGLAVAGVFMFISGRVGICDCGVCRVMLDSCRF